MANKTNVSFGFCYQNAKSIKVKIVRYYISSWWSREDILDYFYTQVNPSDAAKSIYEIKPAPILNSFIKYVKMILLFSTLCCVYKTSFTLFET